MPIRVLILTLSLLFMGFTLEALPLSSFFSWFTPVWVLLVVTMLVLKAPTLFGVWLALPLGLLLDVQQDYPFGLNVITLSVHIVIVQFAYRKIAQVSNFILLTLFVGLLVLVRQILAYTLLNLISLPHLSMQIWQPCLTSMLVWPWFYIAVNAASRKLNLL